MTLLSRKVDYALLILSYLHRRHPEGGNAREIAAQFELSRAFVANILKILCQQGFVGSHRGVKGGYILQRPADEISLAELMEALDESFSFAECSSETATAHLCAHKHLCPVRGAISEVHRRIREILRNVTLAEVFGGTHDGWLQIGLGLSPVVGQLAAVSDTN